MNETKKETALLFVKEQTAQICLSAVQKDGLALRFVRSKMA